MAPVLEDPELCPSCQGCGRNCCPRKELACQKEGNSELQPARSFSRTHASWKLGTWHQPGTPVMMPLDLRVALCAVKSFMRGPLSHYLAQGSGMLLLPHEGECVCLAGHAKGLSKPMRGDLTSGLIALGLRNLIG